MSIKVSKNIEIEDTGVSLGDIGKYSTDEIRIGTWIDNKPLYRKTYTVNALGNANAIYVPLGFSNYQTHNLYGIATNGSLYIPINNSEPIAGNTHSIGAMVDRNSNSILIITATNKTSYSAEITIEYTKTTD